MRPVLLALCLFVAVSTAPTARAAPTCQDRQGQTTRCGTPNAMPVGWSLPPDEQPPGSAAPSLRLLWGPIGLIVGLLGLIAAMPDFDGWRDGDWDAQEGDENDES